MATEPVPKEFLETQMQFPRQLTKLFFLLATYILSSAAFGQNDDSPPSSPREFHDQEMLRIVRGLESHVKSPIASIQSDFDVLYYDLSLDLRDYAGRTIRGVCVMTAVSLADDLTEMVLDLCSTLIVDSAICGGGPRPFTLDNNLLRVTLDRTYVSGDTVTLRIVYRGRPCQTNQFTSFTWYRVFNNDTIPTIYTLSEPYGARDWWPSKNLPDDKADSARISITVSDTLTATSNGLLTQVIHTPPFKTFRWFERYPIATYLISVNATNYAFFRDWYVSASGDSVPLDFYTYPERLPQAQISWSGLPQMMEFMSELFGEYPFVEEKYGHSMFGFSGGMEHQTNTSYGRSITNGQHTYDYIMLHELAHQWWGDEVTLATWPDIWLNEGFASYCEALWQEHLTGFEGLRTWQTSLFFNGVSDPSGPVYNPTQLFDGNTVYNKGSWILHILRGVVRNDSAFFSALREYRTRHAGRSATTDDFLRDVSDALNFEVAPYLYAYLYLTNRPIYRVSFGTGRIDGRFQTAVRVRQIQTDPNSPFWTRLDLRLGAGADTHRVRVENYAWQQRYYLMPAFQPTQLSIDPDDWVLKSWAAEAMPVTVLNTELSFADASEFYTDTLVAVGGQPPYTWNLGSQLLPPGITLEPNGVLHGTPASGGIYWARFVVRDQAMQIDSVKLYLYVLPFVPPAPENLSILLNEAGLLELRWTSSAPVDSFRVFRATRADLADAQMIASTAETFATDTLSTDALGPVSARFYQVISYRDFFGR